MHRRARHINPKNFGAALAFDSRFLQLNNDDLVSSWTDRAAAVSYTASGAARPTFKTSISGGSPMVLSASGNEMIGGTTEYLSNSASITVFVVSSSSNSGNQCIASIKGKSGQEYVCYQLNGTAYWGFRQSYSGSRTYTRPAANTLAIECVSNEIAYIDGAAVSGSPQYHNGSGNSNILCNLAGSGYAWIGYIGQIIAIDAALPAPLLKRLTHAAAFSFKLSCS